MCGFVTRKNRHMTVRINGHFYNCLNAAAVTKLLNSYYLCFDFFNQNWVFNTITLHSMFFVVSMLLVRNYLRIPTCMLSYQYVFLQIRCKVDSAIAFNSFWPTVVISTSHSGESVPQCSMLCEPLLYKYII